MGKTEAVLKVNTHLPFINGRSYSVSLNICYNCSLFMQNVKFDYLELIYKLLTYGERLLAQEFFGSNLSK